MSGSAAGQVRVPLADLRATPQEDAERVNQALLGTPLTILETAVDGGGTRWLQVRLPDYEGWMHEDAVSRTPPPADASHGRVTAASTLLRLLDTAGRPGAGTLVAYAGTILPLARPVAGGLAPLVRLPDGPVAAVDAAALAPCDPAYRGDAAAVLATAREFLGTRYLWGGMTVEGIDCSGLTQIAYRIHGWTLPRDADQQLDRLPIAVPAGAWQPGDLIFYGHSLAQVVHVMLYVGAGQVLHARGGTGVVVQSMDPGRADYHARTDQYLGARRVIPAAPGEE